MSPKIAEMRSSIGELVNLPPERVGITATSGEALTDFGRGLGISVFCIATAEVY
ncbi:MAG: 2-C-methyl-D-erythritol 2,4-cyclodiphosphate synthase [Angelakisella sp.]